MSSRGSYLGIAVGLETSGERSVFVTLDNERRRVTFGRAAHLRLGEDDIPHVFCSS